MKERIRENLNNIADLEDRKLLKEIMNYVFDGMVDYTDSVYENIRKRVFDEINLDYTRKNIYVTICERSRYDGIDKFMFPLDSKDLHTNFEKAETIIEKQSKGEKIVLGRTFFACDYMLLSRVKQEQPIYNGILITNQHRYEVKIRLQQSHKYIDMIRNLYYYYQQNNLNWVSLNAPYFYKFFEFILENELSLDEKETIERVEVSFGELDSFRNDNVLPLWNLEETHLFSTNFPIATGDNLRYQHKFNIPSGDSIYESIVRFEKEHDGYVIRDEESISIILSEENIEKWPVYKIHNPDSQFQYDYGYPVFSNAWKEKFLVGYARQQVRVIRTQAELYRQLYSFEASDLFKIRKIEILPFYKEVGDSYPVNDFIEEDIRPDDGRKIMLISYEAIEKNYLSIDVMSFIISELQQYFPEYKCIGKMVN